MNRVDHESHCRNRGICADCGRPLRLVALQPSEATLECRACGGRVSARPGSGLYRRAREMSQAA